MSHPEVENNSPFEFEQLYLTNEDGYPIVVLIVKATYTIGNSLTLAEEQRPVIWDGEYYGPPETSSQKYEPETAFIKPSTDVALIGSAYPKRAGDRQVDVTLRVGEELQKTARVFGDRKYVKRMGIVDMTNPEPIEQVPLIYERAFGGWDSAEPDPMNCKFEPKNPVGCGFKRNEWEEGLPVPNIEDPKNLLGTYGSSAPPVGFGFLLPHWLPRSKYVGTYDQKWEDERSPLLPTDFDIRFFNAASSGLISKEYLKGDETVSIENASPNGSINFNLPGISPPQIRIRLRGPKDETLSTNLDTVIINTDENVLQMLWRTNMVVNNGPHDVQLIEINANVPETLSK